MLTVTHGRTWYHGGGVVVGEVVIGEVFIVAVVIVVACVHLVNVANIHDIEPPDIIR
jgi:hypothetical protein